MLHGHVGAGITLAEVALDVTARGYRQMNPADSVVKFGIKAGVASHPFHL
jgi:uncharacterized protein YaaW (UPF0174 family)